MARRSVGIPNWRNAASYPTKLSPQGWAWEFLRRNRSYRRDYAQAIRLFRTHQHYQARHPEFDQLGNALYRNYVDWIRDVRARWGLSVPSTKALPRSLRVSKKILVPLAHPKLAATKLHSPAEFDTNLTPLARAYPHSAQRLPGELAPLYERAVAWYLRPGEMTLLFNCAGNLKKQIKSAEKMLMAEKEFMVTKGYAVEPVKRGGRDDAHLKVYLRILDAEKVGAGISEIGDFFFREKKLVGIPISDVRSKRERNLKNALAQAQLLRDEKYYELSNRADFT